MSKIFVPIDSSNVKDVIPEGEDITYSSSAKGWYFENLGMGKTKKTKWKTHILLTEKSIAFTVPATLLYTKKERKNLTPREEICLPLSKGLSMGKRVSINVSGPTIGPIGVVLTLERNPDFESKESFKDRSKRFLNMFNTEEAIEQRKSEPGNIFVEKIQNNPDYSYKEYKKDGGQMPSMAFKISKKMILKGKIPPDMK